MVAVAVAVVVVRVVEKRVEEKKKKKTKPEEKRTRAVAVQRGLGGGSTGLWGEEQGERRQGTHGRSRARTGGMGAGSVAGQPPQEQEHQTARGQESWTAAGGRWTLCCCVSRETTDFKSPPRRALVTISQGRPRILLCLVEGGGMWYC